MELNEFNKQLTKIKEEKEKAERELYIKYAKSQEKFGIGDIITNGIVVIIIIGITAYIGFDGIPVPAYRGRELNKNLEPKKKKSILVIYSNHNVKLIKKAELTERELQWAN